MFVRKNKILKIVIATFFAVSYLFVFLFSSLLHNHKTEFDHLSFKKSEVKFSKINLNQEKSGDCLSCHFIATGNTLAPEQFSFHFEDYTYQVKEIISVQEKIWSQTKFTFNLRGPPAIS